MSKTPVSVLLLAALALCAVVGAPPALAVDTCPNAAFRTGPSAVLPDCRAYELVTPDSNHASGGLQPGGHASADGNVMEYQMLDAPMAARGTNIFNVVRATRDAQKGWTGASISPPIPAPSTVFQGSLTVALSADLSSTAEVSDQPLTGGIPPNGQNVFVRRPDGSYRLITNVGTPLFPFLDIYSYRGLSWGNHDFSQVYIQTGISQLPETSDGSTYAWSEERGLRVVSVLPDGTPAPNGGSLASGMLQPASDDGKYVAFAVEGMLYLRIDDAATVELGPVALDPTRQLATDQAGVAADGSKVLFTSRAEVTADANTGESGGCQTMKGEISTAMTPPPTNSPT